ncbi:MAG: CGxCxC motif mini-lipoprotein [Akkermansia sp.]|nr:CGxCxC motif mini-lipoprotein [Akkermansia sp.]
MKIIVISLLGALVTVAVTSCGGNCACNSYNSDYLRDVPRSSSRSFR